jgi:hypothetical protein
VTSINSKIARPIRQHKNEADIEEENQEKIRSTHGRGDRINRQGFQHNYYKYASI